MIKPKTTTIHLLSSCLLTVSVTSLYFIDIYIYIFDINHRFPPANTEPEPVKAETLESKSETRTSILKINKVTVPKVNTQPPPTPPVPTVSLTLLSSLQEIRRRLELAESGLTSHLHVPLGDNSVYECSVHIQRLQVCNQ